MTDAAEAPEMEPEKEQTSTRRVSCFVIMPSGNRNEYEGGTEESDFIFSGIISEAAKIALGPEVIIIRETDSYEAGAIDKSIVRKIARSDYVIVDITGLNPNVFFELGMRYVLSKTRTILIKQENTDAPFDINAYRHVEYKPVFNGPMLAIDNIVNAINSAKNHEQVDSLVYDTFPDLKVILPDISTDEDYAFRRGPIEGIMPWSDYWKRLNSIVNMLSEKIENGIYVPDAIVGISNGGMMVADLIGRKLLRGSPVISLWANRWDKNARYFDNPTNIGVLKGLSSFLEGDPNKRILIVDDIVASGNTIRQAIEFVKNQIEDCEVAFTPLFSRNPHYMELIDDVLVWELPEFESLPRPYIDQSAIYTTAYLKLPYDKDIRSA